MNGFFHRGGRRVKRGLMLVCLTLALCLLTACGSETTDKVSLLGNDLSGLSREELEKSIEKIVGQNPITDDIVVRFLGGEYTIAPDDISVKYDTKQMASDAMNAGTPGFFGLFGGSDEVEEITPSYTYDAEALERQVNLAAAELNRASAEFSYEIGEDSVTVTKGGAGATVKKDELLAALQERLAVGDFSAVELEADVTSDEMDFEALKSEIDRPVQNPMLDLKADPTGTVMLEAQRGIEMDIEEAKKAFEQSGNEPEFTFPVKFTEPTMSMQDFQSKLFRDTLSTVTSSFNPGLKGRTTNVKLACDFCNDIILNPGDEFSYNGAVGPRTYERGFKDATVYVAGTTEEGVGGGICQVSSTIYSAALHADLKIVERHNHSYMITYVPLGEDATVVYGSKDFRFQNNTDYPVKIRVTYGKNTMTVSLIGTNVSNKTVEIATKRLSSTPFNVIYQTDPSIPVDTQKVKNNGYTGYVTESYRIVYENGEKVSETFENKSIYKKLDKLILENPSTPEKSGNYVAPVVNPDPQPPVTEPPVTEPPVTEPPVTEPPVTDATGGETDPSEGETNPPDDGGTVVNPEPDNPPEETEE